MQNNQCWYTPRVCTWPLTFFIYVNDVVEKKKYSLNNIAEIECCINQDLKTLYMWSKQRIPQFKSTRIKAVVFTLKMQ